MKLASKLTILVILLAATQATEAAQPRFRRAARPERYDPFQEEDSAVVHPEQRRGASWIKPEPKSAEVAAAVAEKEPTGRYGDSLLAGSTAHPNANASTSAEPVMNESSESFKTVSYEPEYIVDDVYTPVYPCDSGAPGCGDACCDGYAASPPIWHPRWTAFGEYLLLRPRDFEVAYAVEVDQSNTTFPDPLLVSPAYDVDPDASSGFRAGIGFQMGPCDTITGTFTHFESDNEDSFDSSPAGQATSRVQSLVLFQGAAEDFDSAEAQAETDFQLVDVDYHRLVCGVDWFAGIRIAWLDQDFHAEFLEGTTNFREVVTDVDFHGAGLRFGLGKEHRDPCLGWLVYARGAGNFLGGRFETDFLQSSDTDPSEAATNFNADRLVTMFDLEVGFGWQNPCGRLRLTAGYTLSYWFNVVTTGDLVTTVPTGAFNTLGDRSIGFDGLTARAEYRF